MLAAPNLFLIGATGAGKTALGRRLAAHYALAFVDLDAEIEREAGASIPMLFEHEGEARFRAREAACLDAATRRDGIVLATGAGAILDADNRARLAARGVVIWLPVTIDEQLARLRHDVSRPLLAGGDRRARLEAMADRREPLYRASADLVLPAADAGVAAALARCVALVDARWQRAAADARRAEG